MMNPLNRVGAALEEWLLEPIDARVYALVRMAYGLVCFSIIVETFPVRAELFSENGMSWHRPDLLFYIPLKYATSTGQVTALMVLAAVCSLMHAAGLFTRATAIVLYFWNFAYCAIGYPAESGYDGIARIVGFIMVWAPTIRTWSLDERIFGPGEKELPRYALRLIQFQILIIYVCTVWLKAPDGYWRNGELMSYFMMSMYSRFQTWHWAEWGRASALMSWGTLFAETMIPICLLINPRLRWFGFLLGLGLHGGIAVTSTIGMFSFAMLPLYVAFLQREDIDMMVAQVDRLRRGKREAKPAVEARGSAREQNQAKPAATKAEEKVAAEKVATPEKASATEKTSTPEKASVPPKKGRTSQAPAKG
jgi:uncharacterized membrane protein YphA (DoxX/SURF4 family)